MKTIKRLIFCLMAMFSVTTLSAQSIYDFTVKDDAGNDVSLAAYKGKVLLIVNTATRCGFTPPTTSEASSWTRCSASAMPTTTRNQTSNGISRSSSFLATAKS